MHDIAAINAISRAIIGEAIRVHRTVGSIALESAYEQLLANGLTRRGHRVERQVPLSIIDEGVEIRNAYRIDLLVDGCVIVEVKCAARESPVFRKQLLTYLRLSGLPLGLIVNFGKERLVDGITRLVHHLPE